MRRRKLLFTLFVIPVLSILVLILISNRVQTAQAEAPDQKERPAAADVVLVSSERLEGEDESGSDLRIARFRDMQGIVQSGQSSRTGLWWIISDPFRRRISKSPTD